MGWEVWEPGSLLCSEVESRTTAPSFLKQVVPEAEGKARHLVSRETRRWGACLSASENNSPIYLGTFEPGERNQRKQQVPSPVDVTTLDLDLRAAALV